MSTHNKLSCLRKKWGRKLKKKSAKIRRQQQLLWRILKTRLFFPKAVFLVLTPEHENLGDHAIARAEAELLNDLRICYCEITGAMLYSLEQKGWLGLMNGRPILVNGGGYLGTLWPRDERIVRAVVRANPRSPILLFPNSAVYEDSTSGRDAAEEARRDYYEHGRVKSYARERQSLAVEQELFPYTELAPDMAMRLTRPTARRERKGCCLLLREDRERTRSEEANTRIIQVLREIFDGELTFADTVRQYGVSPSNREAELEKLFTQLEQAELVVTDRLHGMVFAAICGTPCIVLDSKSPKVRGCYEWIKNLAAVRFCEDPASIAGLYAQMPHGERQYDPAPLLPFYGELIADLKVIWDKNWPYTSEKRAKPND